MHRVYDVVIYWLEVAELKHAAVPRGDRESKLVVVSHSIGGIVVFLMPFLGKPGTHPLQRYTLYLLLWFLGVGNIGFC